ncbi:uncharacterized protein PITG_07260 [Phytophthora infestans T30-4]|uniref:Uncharacterized protein n=1 Tax=Phytophthora infestans (strain T30-4) TaxID=403677 RepID=D0N7N1_PHYIT|nr:uncharacterized protein PITG_07260 [Phytophthora infestans T30-4]EEY53580.1 conserved hypothetical protein [Phytophthora infestans T30-4]|eukprot:XP_002905198.1 conserved hypothetical protein [Phytophthora infestans T30-4]
MPRPILKMRSSYASPVRSSDSASKREKRSITIRRLNAASRRVTFSPFTKLRGDSRGGGKGLVEVGIHVLQRYGSREKSRRKQELETMQTLYRAAKRRPHSVKSLLLTNVPGLKRLNTWMSDWVDYAKTMRDALPWHQRASPKRRPRRPHRDPWTALNDADHEYVQQLALSSTMSSPTLLLPASPPSRDDNPLAIVHRSPQPDLTPPNRGSFTNLLRKEGVPVEEDERRVSRAIDEDLRGVSHHMKRRRCQR